MLGESYPFAEMQSMYSVALVDWATIWFCINYYYFVGKLFVSYMLVVILLNRISTLVGYLMSNLLLCVCVYDFIYINTLVEIIFLTCFFPTWLTLRHRLLAPRTLDTSPAFAGLSGIRVGWGIEINGRFVAERPPALVGWAATFVPCV